jgi:2-polyprenyl-3-methyl-5-hydroxy-6-metoxy-1,4-benzoquinol methylase
MTTGKVWLVQKPRGWIGRLILWQMNAHHSKLTDWGLAHVFIEKHDTVLDIGCGGGRTVSKLARKAVESVVYSRDDL